MIRLDFPGYSGEQSLEPIEWDQWFEKFDSSGLVLVYEETTAKGARKPACTPGQRNPPPAVMEPICLVLEARSRAAA